jgi:hypothetical protein
MLAAGAKVAAVPVTVLPEMDIVNGSVSPVSVASSSSGVAAVPHDKQAARYKS